MIYASTFTTGAQKYITKLLKDFHTSVKILSTLDGLIVYSCESDQKKVSELRFFTNTFIVISEYKKCDILGFGTLVKKELNSKNIENFTSTYFRTPKKFRIVFMDRSIPSSVNSDLRQSLENKISQNKKLIVNRVIPDCEFWFMRRSEHVSYFLYRLTYHPSAEKQYRKGELHREVCQVLNAIAEPKRTDIFLDPFCGYASLGLERLYFGECGNIICVDDDDAKIAEAKHRISRCAHPSKFDIRKDNFFDMKFEYESIDKIVTDPPWGVFSSIDDIGGFYKRLLSKIEKIIKKDGIIVLLTSKKNELEEQLNQFDNLKKLERLDVLISGKKAAIFKIIKIMSK